MLQTVPHMVVNVCARFQVLENAFISENNKKQVSECVVGDSNASILLKARGKECEEITSGRSLKITGCKVDMYHGSMRLICDLEGTTITEIDAVSPNVRVPLPALFVKSRLKIIHLAESSRSTNTRPWFAGTHGYMYAMILKQIF